MLVLARRRNEGIVIGDGITVTVVEIRGNQVRLGIEAPKQVRVLREELAEAEVETVRVNVA
jgi:carbon storage regulator